MDKIISFINSTENKRKNMYEEMISRLEKAPANNYVVKEAENLADEVLVIYGHVGKIAPTPIIKIVQDFGFKACKAANMPKDISGNIFVGGNTKKNYGTDKVIIVGDDEPLQHQRFIIAHELAHYLMDYVGSENYKKGKITFSRTYPKINHQSSEEIRADRFAAELLMPKQVFFPEYRKAMKKSDYSKEYTVTYLAKLFNTKESCIQRRIKEVLEEIDN